MHTFRTKRTTSRLACSPGTIVTIVFAALLAVTGSIEGATFTVDITTDTVDTNIGDGTCADSNGDCSVRAAIQEANSGGPHTVSIPAGTYTLSIAGGGEELSATGDLDIRVSMTITGAGADQTIIDANEVERVFHVVFSTATATIQDLAITGGHPGSGNGGGIYNNGSLTVRRCDIYGNRAGTNLGSEGGGIFNLRTLNVVDSTIRDNFGARSGAGIAAFCGASPTTTVITNSTISGNVGEVQGLNNPLGGGIAHTCSAVRTWLNNVTISDNSATPGLGGGIYSIGFGGGGLFDIRNSIIDGNSSDCFGDLTSYGYNLIGNTSGCTVTATTGDLFNTSASLQALADNGGTTMTHEILASSPAFDGGNPSGCADQSANPITTDQRGTARPQADRCDIGAFEQDDFPTTDLIISKTDGAAAIAGGTVTYTITVDNDGSDDATGVSVTESPAAGLSFVSGTDGCAAGFPWVIGNLAANDSVSCTATFSVPSNTLDGAVLDNTASVDGDEYDPDPDDNDSTAQTTVSREVDLQVSVGESDDPIVPGVGNLTYTVTVANAGPSDAGGVALSIALTLPAGVTVDSVVPDTGSFADPTWTVGGLTAGGSATLTVTLLADQTTAIGTDVIDITATVTSADETLVTTGDDSANEATSVISPADVSATKEVDGTLLVGGPTPGTVIYTIVLSNAGPGPQQDNTGDEFTDVLPPELTLVDALADSGTANAETLTNTVTWNGSIPAGGSVTITINATINSDVLAGVTISNQGDVSYDSDGDGTNESSAQTQGAGGGATTFVTQAAASIPTLDFTGLGLLTVLLLAGGIAVLRR